MHLGWGRDVRATPEETGVILPVPSARVQHVGSEDVADDRDDVVEVSAEDDGLDLKSSGGKLGNEGVGDGADGELVEESPDKHETAMY